MPVDAAPELASLDLSVASASPVLLEKRQDVVRRRRRPLAHIIPLGQIIPGCLGFLAIWMLFYQTWQAFPYLSSGSDVVFRTKIQAERRSGIFRTAQPGQKKLLIFGTSKILSGFIPEEFDQASAHSGFSFFSFNSGYPARDSFVPELKAMAENGTVPDILLLTEAWSSQEAATLFRPIENEHALAEVLFPFRHLLRDSLSFAINARQHGGAIDYYRLARQSVDQMMKDRGYYFIAEQSHYPQDRLPDTFSLPTDNRHHVAARAADPQSSQGAELRRLIAKYGMTCLYVPAYARSGAVAAAPRENAAFRKAAEAVGCRAVGPDYFSYPNSLFSDEIHLNRAGARVFTADLFQTIREALSNDNAVQ